MRDALQALKSEPIGGSEETLYLMMIAAGLLSVFPPFAGWITHSAEYVKIGFDALGARIPTPTGALKQTVDIAQTVGTEIAYRASFLSKYSSKLPDFARIPPAIIKFGLLASSTYASYKLGYAALKKKRLEFILHSSCQVESSDPPAVALKTPGLLFGYTTDTGEPLFISDEDLVRHGIFEGQTGMGKSVLGKSLMFQQIQRGGGLLFIDGKLDEDNIQDIYEYCVYCGRGNDFFVVNPGRPEQSNTYNPILFGDPDEIAARIIGLIPDTTASPGSDHYKQSATLALVCFISALQEESPEQIEAWLRECKKNNYPPGYEDHTRIKGKAYNFLDLALLTMSEGVLNSLMLSVQHNAEESLARKNLTIFLEQYAKDNGVDGQINIAQVDLKKLKEVLGGIGARMHQFGSGKFGPILNSYSPEIKMYEAIRDGKIVYVALPTMGKDVAAQNLGKIVIGDLRTSISWLQMNKHDRPKIPFLAFMDEMNSYSTEILAIMFEQARSARVALFPAIQTDSGLTKISDDFKERILASTELKVFFRLSSQETATTASELIGETKRVLNSTSDGTGLSASAQALELGPNKSLSDSSNSSTGEREQLELMVSPDKIKGLEAGECIVLRAPKVWNIRVPLIELDDETKKAIGPLKINHGRGYVTPTNSFDAMKNIDLYIRDAQKRRIKPPKKKAGSDQSGSKTQPKESGNSANADEAAQHDANEAEEAELPTMENE